VLSNWPSALTIELGYEGGLTNNPKDPGGLTNWGVTLPAMTEFLGRPAVSGDIVNLTRTSAGDVYHKLYWPAVRGDDLPAGVDLVLFDEAINAGRGRAVQHLQQALGVMVDRKFGKRTLAATLAAKPLDLIEAIRQERVSFYQGLANFPIFGTGWLRRVNSVSATATSWATKAA
jgi:lysozyme family protein